MKSFCFWSVLLPSMIISTKNKEILGLWRSSDVKFLPGMKDDKVSISRDKHVGKRDRASRFLSVRFFIQRNAIGYSLAGCRIVQRKTKKKTGIGWRRSQSDRSSSPDTRNFSKGLIYEAEISERHRKIWVVLGFIHSRDRVISRGNLRGHRGIPYLH